MAEVVYEDPDETGDPLGALDALGAYGALTPEEMEMRGPALETYNLARGQYEQGMNAYDRQVAAAQAARNLKALRQQEALDRLLQQRDNYAPLLLSLSAGLAKPTKTGSLGETISNAAGAVVKPTEDVIATRRRRDADRLALETGVADLGIENAEAEGRAGLQKAQAASSLINKAMQTHQQQLSLQARMRGSDPEVLRLQRVIDDPRATPGAKAAAQAKIDQLKTSGTSIERAILLPIAEKMRKGEELTKGEQDVLNRFRTMSLNEIMALMFGGELGGGNAGGGGAAPAAGAPGGGGAPIALPPELNGLAEGQRVTHKNGVTYTRQGNQLVPVR